MQFDALEKKCYEATNYSILNWNKWTPVYKEDKKFIF